METIQKHLDQAKLDMEKAYFHTQTTLSKINIGRATPTILQDIKIDYYGSMTPLNQIATIGTTDVHTLSIQPWENKTIDLIQKAIQESQLGLSSQNDGHTILVHVPTPSKERRGQLVKLLKSEVEKGKVVIRNIRRDHKELLKQSQKSGIPEDDVRRSEKKLQEFTDEYIKRLDLLGEKKEISIMTI